MSSMSVNESNHLHFKLSMTLLPYVTACIFEEKLYFIQVLGHGGKKC
jgi:hypothetical protein